MKNITFKNTFRLSASILFALVLSTCATIVHAQSNDEKTLNNFIEKAMMTCPALPGMGVAIVKDGKPVLIKGYGYADPLKKQKASAETAFYIASSTKSFTGLLALILESEGRIKFDAPLTTYKPFRDLKNSDVFQNISIRELLNHTSGISNPYITFREAYSGDKPIETLTMLLAEKTNLREQGKKYAYDNLGYNLFGLLLKAEFGWNWQDLLQQKIFDPLAMKQSSGYMSVAGKNNWSLAWPYLPSTESGYNRGELMKTDAMMQAAGGLICSAKDAGAWLALYQNKGMVNGKQVIRQSLLEESIRPSATTSRSTGDILDEGYGVGWTIARYKSTPLYYHNGGYSGFFSRIVQMPERNVGIAIFTNESMSGSIVSELILSYVLDYYLNNGSVDQAAYDTRLEDMGTQVSTGLSRLKEQMDMLAERPWKLTLPKKAFCGTYENKHFGTVIIEETNDNLIVKMGDMSIKATPYTQDNTMRIQIGQSGSVLSFQTEDKRIVAMQYNNDKFNKIK